MKLIAVCLVLVLTTLGYVSAVENEEAQVSSVPRVPAERARVSNGTSAERFERAMKIKAGTKHALGQFKLHDGSTLELSTAETADSQVCLIEEHSRSGASAGCLEGGLFRIRKVEFSVSTDGGPDTFTELYVAGVVAPGIGSAALELTDGTLLPLQLTAQRTFIFESSKSALEAHVYPTAFHLFRVNGKLAERLSFPPAGG